MNGDWFRWSGAANGRDAEGYVAAWRRLHRIFGEQGADNVSWVWSPNWNSSPDQVWNRMADYYPGDRHVDWVGVSGYDMGGESPQALFGGIYAEFAARKPIIVAEVGAVDRGPGTKADWITRFAAWVKAHPAVGAVVWFDTDTHPQSPQRWRIDTDAEALAAFKAMAVEATFGG
jgi:beta-mannanase